MQTIQTQVTQTVARTKRNFGQRALLSLRKNEQFTTIITIAGILTLAAGLITDDRRWIVATLLLWLPAFVRMTLESAQMIIRDLRANK